MRHSIGLLALLALVPACSALVAPDPNRLGGTDASIDGAIGAIDADGPRPDADRPDGSVACPTSCDDGVPCTTDGCDPGSGRCSHTPMDALCGAGMRCASAGCVPIACTTSADCADADPCNGDEVCSPGNPGADPTTGCARGTPIDCGDGSACTADRCEPGVGCMHETDPSMCDDGTPCTTDTCTAGGCEHTPNDDLCNGGCRTGATCVSGEGCRGGTSLVCASDGNPCTSDPMECDAATGSCLHPGRDDDGDGHRIAVGTGSMGTVVCEGGDDCNDRDPNVFPGALERCNGVDDNCNGSRDEGCGTAGPDTCASEQPIMLTSAGSPGRFSGSATGTTAGLGDDYLSTCGNTDGGRGGPDAVYYVDLPPAVSGFGEAYDVTISTDSDATVFDSVVAGFVGACGTFTGPCNDDVSRSNQRSSVTFCVGRSSTTGTRVHVLVDGFGGGASGSYNVTVTAVPHIGSCP